MKVNYKHLESFGTSCRRTIEINWYDRVRNEVVLYGDKEERNIMHTMKRRMLNGLVTSAVEISMENTSLKKKSN